VTKGIDNLKKIKYKQARLQGKSIRQGLRDAGYTEASASHSSGLGVVKCSEVVLEAMVKASDISVDWVVGKLNQELLNIHAKSSDRVRILELLGKYLNMFKDNQVTQVSIFQGLSDKDLPPIDITEVKPNQEDKPIC